MPDKVVLYALFVDDFLDCMHLRLLGITSDQQVVEQWKREYNWHCYQIQEWKDGVTDKEPEVLFLSD